ncbi:MAG TPA: MMPL family transporter [Gemmatimonadaceae bacterium]|nr:MMPL family transporter [Gemmatimonadaceae bacterium]
MSQRWEKIARAVIERRKWIFAGWIVAAALILPNASKIQQRLDVAARVPGSESARVEALLATRFSAGFAQYAVLVIQGGASPETPSGIAILEQVRSSLSTLPVVSRTFSFLDAPDSMFVGPRGETFLVVGLNPGNRKADELIPLLRAETSRLRAALRQTHPGVDLMWTGETALNFDIRQASASDAEQAEKRVLPVTLLLLIIAFGAIAASILPLVVGGFAIALALGAAVVISGVWPLSILLQNVVTMLGLGLGIDYALLVVARFRETLDTGVTVHDAARDAAVQAGHTIVVSGASVAIGFATLLVIPVNEVRSIAVGGLLVITMAVLLSVTLLPAILAVVGKRINWGRIRVLRTRDGSASWRRWAGFVTAHPIRVLMLAGIPTGILALQSARLSSDLPRGDWLPPAMESAKGLHALRGMDRSGIVNAVRIIVDLPAGSPWDSPAGWQAVSRASDVLAADTRVARVRSLPSVTGLTNPNLQLISAVPPHILGSLASRDGRSALIELMPTEAASQSGAMDLVRELRTRPPSALTGLPGTTFTVGGLPAFNVDYESAIGDRFWSVVAAVVLVTMFALFLGFRSVLIAVKAMALNLLSVAAAFGAVVLVFQDGIGLSLLGLAQPLDGTFAAVPIIVFCVVFGLSMDYEVFLVARIAEARRKGSGDSEAIAEGLARTGGLITSAAAIMIAVFAAFTIGDFVIVKILGLALGVAVLVDATVVRMAIGPALFTLAGRWNWWPGESVARRVSVQSPAAHAEANA